MMMAQKTDSSDGSDGSENCASELKINFSKVTTKVLALAD